MSRKKQIKNFFVRSETIQNGSRGFYGYVEYLKDSQHKNHKERTTVVEIHEPEHFKRNVVAEADELQATIDKRGKGGRPISSFAQSFVFSPPVGFHKPTKSEWKKMAGDFLDVIAEKLNVSKKSLSDHVMINIHDQSNSHLNILVGRIQNGKNYQQVLTRPSTTNALKRQFERSMRLHCGKDIGDYVPVVPSGSTKGARWDERRKYEDALKAKEQKRLEDIRALQNLVVMSADAIKSNLDDDVARYKSEIKNLTKKLNQQRIEDESKEILEAIKKTNEGIDSLNELDSSKRKLRTLKKKGRKP